MQSEGDKPWTASPLRLSRSSLTSSFGVAGAHASTPEAAASGLSQDEYLEVVEQLAERLRDVEGFEDLEDAMGAIDDLEEDAQAAVSYEAAAGDEEVSAILVSTPEEHDFFDGYYQDVVDECRTLDLGDGEIEFQLTDSADGCRCAWRAAAMRSGSTWRARASAPTT